MGLLKLILDFIKGNIDLDKVETIDRIFCESPHCSLEVLYGDNVLYYPVHDGFFHDEKCYWDYIQYRIDSLDGLISSKFLNGTLTLDYPTAIKRFKEREKKYY